MTTRAPEGTCRGTRHRSLRAHREYGCTCPGESWDRWLRYRARAAERARATNSLRNRSTTVSMPVGRFRANDAHRELRERNDLACRGEDPELFHIEGDGQRGTRTADQIEQARGVCHRCPAASLCLTAALAQHDPWAFLGGHSPKERERLRRRMRETVRAA